MMRSLALALLLSCFCTACTFVSTLRVSASLDQTAPPSIPVAQVVPKFAAFLVAKGLPQADPKTFGVNGRYEFHTYHGTRTFGMNEDDEYLSVYAGDAYTVIVEVTRISDSSRPPFPDDVIEGVRSQAQQYLHEVTGDTYKVVVIQQP